MELVRVAVEKPLTLRDIMPGSPLEANPRDLVITAIYDRGTRLDNGWMYRWDGINRRIPEMVERKHKGKRLQRMVVIVDHETRSNIRTIIAYYTQNCTVEYSVEVKEVAYVSQ